MSAEVGHATVTWEHVGQVADEVTYEVHTLAVDRPLTLDRGKHAVEAVLPGASPGAALLVTRTPAGGPFTGNAYVLRRRATNTTEGGGDDGSTPAGDAREGDGATGHDGGRDEPEPPPAMTSPGCRPGEQGPVPPVPGPDAGEDPDTAGSSPGGDVVRVPALDALADARLVTHPDGPFVARRIARWDGDLVVAVALLTDGRRQVIAADGTVEVLR